VPCFRGGSWYGISCRSFWQYDRGHPAFDERGADCTVDEMANLRRRRGLHDESARHVLEQARKIDFLLIMTAERGARLLAGNGKDRHVVEPRVIKAGDQMRGTGPGSRNADTQLAGEFGIGRSHEGRHFLMPRLNELDLALGALQRAKNAIDAVARVAEDFPHTP
jgi:hypothetical protein